MVDIRRAALPPVWARDPFGRFPHRLFDGRTWTDRVARGGRTLQDAFLMGSPTPPPELPTNCDECGFHVGDAKFCPRCGTAAPPPVRAPYCYQCGSSPPAGAAFCDECGSRLDALAPGLSVRDAEKWRRFFEHVGWVKDSPDPKRALKDSEKKISRLHWNIHAQLKAWELPSFDGEDPSEPWILWLSRGDQPRSAWLTAQEAELDSEDEADRGKIGTLIITRARLIALSTSSVGSRPTLLYTDSLANVSAAKTDRGVTRVRFGTSERDLHVEWRAANRPPPVPPAELHALTSGSTGGEAPVPGPPMRRATDRRDSGPFLAESLLTSFGNLLVAISGER